MLFSFLLLLSTDTCAYWAAKKLVTCRDGIKPGQFHGVEIQAQPFSLIKIRWAYS
jgi:hypothetical protein